MNSYPIPIQDGSCYWVKHGYGPWKAWSLVYRASVYGIPETIGTDYASEGAAINAAAKHQLDCWMGC